MILGTLDLNPNVIIKVVGGNERRQLTPKSSKSGKNFFQFFTPWGTKEKCIYVSSSVYTEYILSLIFPRGVPLRVTLGEIASEEHSALGTYLGFNSILARFALGASKSKLGVLRAPYY